MKSIFSKAMMLVAIAAALVSFTPSFGGEGFEISLNGKVLLQQFGKDLHTVKDLQVGQLLPQDKLTIRYFHCGQAGKNRVVTVKDRQNHVLKVWHYEDAASAQGGMLCSSQDIISLKKAGNNVFKLYYSSNELPGGRLLVNIVAGEGNAVAARK